MILSLGDVTPQIDSSAFVAPMATVVGQVRVGAQASVWYSAVLRGDMGQITLGDRSNVQDSSTLHADPGFPVTVGVGVTIGHNALVHGATVEDDCLIGMGATVLNGAVVGTESLVGAAALVPQGMVIPPRSLVIGAPARVIRQLTDEEVAHIRVNGAAYVDLAARHRDSASPVAAS